MAEPRVFQGTGFALAETQADSQVTSVGILGIGNFPAEFVQDSQAGILSVVERTIDTEIAQAGLMVVARGRVFNPRVRAWTFTLDGHDFYVLRLGEQSTIVYDLASEQWTEWGSGRLPFWRASSGLVWVGAEPLAINFGSNIIVGDDTLGLLCFLDPAQAYDDNIDTTRFPQQQFFERIVTGQVLSQGRSFLPCYAIFVEGDNYGLTAVDFPVDVRLETSDDQGRTFDEHSILTVPANYADDNVYTWYSLGQISSPGRIFKIVDNGVFARIDTMRINDD